MRNDMLRPVRHGARAPFPAFSGSIRSAAGLFALAWGLSACARTGGPASPAAGAGGQPVREAAIPPHYSRIDFPELDYVPPHPADHRVELEGGAVAYLVPDSSLDLVDVTVLWGGDFLPGKPHQAAALNLYGSMLKNGGTRRIAPEALEDSLEFLAAELSASMGNHQSSLSLNSLGKDAGPLVELLPEVALQPRMDGNVFRLQRTKYIEALRHRYDTPRGVMVRAYEHVLFGSHPANWQATEAEVKALTPRRLEGLRGAGFSPDGLVIGVAGRFDRGKMTSLLNRLVARFGELKREPGAKELLLDGVPPYGEPREPGVYLIGKEVSQATIRMGAPGVKRPHPEYYPLVVASYVFGDGGFTSRLVARVRSEEGLAYGVGSFVDSDYHRRGTVGVSLQTKAPTGAYAVKLVLEEMRRMAGKGITGEELQRAKDGLIKSLPSLFDTPAATASIFAQSEVWGRDPDHFENYRKRILDMEKSEVEAAFRKYFRPEAMRIVVVGPDSVLARRDERHQAALEDFGTLTRLSLEDIEKREPAPAGSAARKEGRGQPEAGPDKHAPAGAPAAGSKAAAAEKGGEKNGAGAKETPAKPDTEPKGKAP